MKKLALIFLMISITSCTQQSVVKSTALRTVIEKQETLFNQEPDKEKAAELRKQTRIEVANVEMVSDSEANVDVEIKNPSETKKSRVHLLKANGAWSAQN